MRLAVLAAVLAASLLGVAPAAMGQSQPPAVGMGASHWTATYDTTDYQPYVWSSGDGYQETVAWEKATIVASDPRISGSWSQVRDIRAFPNGVPGGPDIWVSSATARIDNADGAWTGTFNGGYEVRDGGFGEEWNMFQGEGAYSGLTAVFHWRSGDAPNLEGVIVPSGLPPTPHAIPSPTPRAPARPGSTDPDSHTYRSGRVAGPVRRGVCSGATPVSMHEPPKGRPRHAHRG